MSISDSIELFKKAFDVTISVEEKKDKDSSIKPPQSWIEYHSSKSVMKIKGLEEIIEGIVLAKPGVPFK